MSQEIRVRPMDDGEWSAEVHEGVDTTTHRVIVGERFLDDLGMPGVEQEQIVRQALEYLLERRTADGLPHDVRLGQLVAEYEDFLPELRTRLTP